MNLEEFDKMLTDLLNEVDNECIKLHSKVEKLQEQLHIKQEQLMHVRETQKIHAKNRIYT